MRPDPTPTSVRAWEPDRWKRVLVRVARTYLQSFVGFLGASALGSVAPGGPVPPPETALMALSMAAYAALFPAGVALIMNALEELNKIDPGTATRG